MINDYQPLAESRPDLYERLLDIIHMLTDKNLRKVIRDQRLFIDWDEIARCMKGNDWKLPPVIKPVTTPEVSRFDRVTSVSLDTVAPVIQRDAPKPLAEVRSELSNLIRETQCVTDRGFKRLLGIVEQIMMNLENVPKFNWSVPGIAPFPMCPKPYEFQPTPSPMPIGPTITCNSGDAVCQSDGYVEHTGQQTPAATLRD